MNVWHCTGAADAILREGFRDSEGTYLTAQTWRGVSVADQPLDAHEGAQGDTYIVLDVPEAEACAV